MRSLFIKLFAVIVFTGFIGLSGAVEHAALPVDSMPLKTELQIAPVRLAAATSDTLISRAADVSGSSRDAARVTDGQRFPAISALSGPADWMLLFCGLVIGVVIALRRLSALRP